jgi:hypothetical protein
VMERPYGIVTLPCVISQKSADLKVESFVSWYTWFPQNLKSAEREALNSNYCPVWRRSKFVA